MLSPILRMLTSVSPQSMNTVRHLQWAALNLRRYETLPSTGLICPFLLSPPHAKSETIESVSGSYPLVTHLHREAMNHIRAKRSTSSGWTRLRRSLEKQWSCDASCHCAWRIREGAYSKLSYCCYTHLSWRLMGFVQDLCGLFHAKPHSYFKVKVWGGLQPALGPLIYRCQDQSSELQR